MSVLPACNIPCNCIPGSEPWTDRDDIRWRRALTSATAEKTAPINFFRLQRDFTRCSLHSRPTVDFHSKVLCDAYLNNPNIHLEERIKMAYLGNMPVPDGLMEEMRGVGRVTTRDKVLLEFESLDQTIQSFGVGVEPEEKEKLSDDSDDDEIEEEALLTPLIIFVQNSESAENSDAPSSSRSSSVSETVDVESAATPSSPKQARIPMAPIKGPQKRRHLGDTDEENNAKRQKTEESVQMKAEKFLEYIKKFLKSFKNKDSTMHSSIRKIRRAIKSKKLEGQMLDSGAIFTMIRFAFTKVKLEAVLKEPEEEKTPGELTLKTFLEHFKTLLVELEEFSSPISDLLIEIDDVMENGLEKDEKKATAEELVVSFVRLPMLFEYASERLKVNFVSDARKKVIHTL